MSEQPPSDEAITAEIDRRLGELTLDNLIDRLVLAEELIDEESKNLRSDT